MFNDEFGSVLAQTLRRLGKYSPAELTAMEETLESEEGRFLDWLTENG